MARDFKTLVRLNEWEVDQKRRELGEQLRQLENLESRLLALEDELVREQAQAAEMPTEGGLFYGAYAEIAIGRRESLQANIAEQTQAVERARDVLSEAYLELKKFEIAEENRVAEVDAEAAHYEQSELDEIGLTQYARKN